MTEDSIRMRTTAKDRRNLVGARFAPATLAMETDVDPGSTTTRSNASSTDASGAPSTPRARSAPRPSLRDDQRGLSAVEYVLVVVGIAIVGLLAWTFFGQAARDTADDATVAIQTMEGWQVDPRAGGDGSGGGDATGSSGAGRGARSSGLSSGAEIGSPGSSGGFGGGGFGGGGFGSGGFGGSGSGGFGSTGSGSGGARGSSGDGSGVSSGRGVLSSIGGFGRGVVEGFVGAGWDTVTGVAGLAVSTVRGVGWVVTNPGEAASNVSSAVTYAVNNPGEVARSAGDLGKAVAVAGFNAAKETVRVVREGTPEERGKLVGAIAFEVATTVGTGGAGQASKLRHADKVADGLRAADRATDVARTADRASDVARTADRATDVGRAADDGLVAVVGRRSDDAADTARGSDYVVDASCSGGVCRRPGSCFVAGTLVRTSEGFAPIESLRVGDVVLARHEKTGELGRFPVIDTIVRDDEPLLSITVESDARSTTGRSTVRSTIDRETTNRETTERDDPTLVRDVLLVTPEHPFHTTRGWVAAKALTPDDRIVRANETLASIVSLEALDRRARVYNLTVDEAHTYFVGEGELWVHNACRNEVFGVPRTRSARDAADAVVDEMARPVNAAGQPLVGRKSNSVVQVIEHRDGSVSVGVSSGLDESQARLLEERLNSRGDGRRYRVSREAVDGTNAPQPPTGNRPGQCAEWYCAREAENYRNASGRTPEDYEPVGHATVWRGKGENRHRLDANEDLAENARNARRTEGATDVDVRADEMTPCATCEANRDLLDRAARGDLSDRLPGQ